MRKALLAVSVLLLFSLPLLGQGKRMWVLRANGEMVEYDPATFAPKQTIKLPTEAAQSPQNVLVNHLGQVLFAPTVPLPLAEDDADATHKAWFWNGRTATTIDQGVTRTSVKEGSNFAITEAAPLPYLSADGNYLFWFANQARRLQREEMDLSTTTTWLSWRTDLTGAMREDLTSSKLPDCRCTTGSCEDTCPYGAVWVPEGGVGKFFLLTQYVQGQTQPTYKASSRYQEEAGKWNASSVSPPLRRVLDAASDGNVILEAVPDTGCCGWVNQSNDQTLLRSFGKTTTVFDEQESFKNPDYDVSFYTSNAGLSPEVGYVAMTIVSTAQPSKAIQLAEQGQANPEESQHIRKALAELPAVEVKSVEDSPRRVAYLPHATLVGWISEEEILVIEDHVLVAYSVGSGARRKSNVRVEDVGRVFLR
ncbi:MAG: hypothetical protein LAO24_12410 [Acidobacteriia bacterium]|nr:hypothetical protein [Terriglobia bacterium]